MKPRSTLRPVLAALARMAPRRLWLGGALLALLTVLMGMALLGLSGWFITATALAGLLPATAIVFDVFMPSAGIRLLALGRTGTRYAERLVTHDATLAVLAALRERLLRSWATPAAALSLRLRPARLLQRLTADVDALDSLYLRLFVPLLAATGATLVAALALGLMRWWLGLALAAWLLATGLGSARWLAGRARRPAVRR
ncbi:ABC transporter ATP-binding protein, partial [Delftia tsuruhatensis]|nr:ABC transporter ATP-binding protein [Delftia tsuruhatensis]